MQTSVFRLERRDRQDDRATREVPALDVRSRRTATQLDDRHPTINAAVQRAKGGDRDAVRFLYVQYADRVYGYVLSILKDEHEAEDVTQLVFVKLMTKIQAYEPHSVPFIAWLIRVSRNVALDHLRQRRSVPCEEVYGPDQRADDSRSDRRMDLTEALGALSPDQRNVVVLRHLVGLSPGEIADRMGKSTASVHGLHHRARFALQGELTRIGSGPSTAAAC